MVIAYSPLFELSIAKKLDGLVVSCVVNVNRATARTDFCIISFVNIYDALYNSSLFWTSLYICIYNLLIDK